MLPAGLIDTGAIVAIVESDDAWHADCLSALASLRFPLLTTEAVLTEAFHLVGRTAHARGRLWGFLRSGGITLAPIENSDLPALHALMAQYNDHPMDFADATLVHLAAREAVSLILTVDHNDFETYRIGGKKKFTILPARRSG